jgi:hypothetical protein
MKLHYIERWSIEERGGGGIERNKPHCIGEIGRRQRTRNE